MQVMCKVFFNAQKFLSLQQLQMHFNYEKCVKITFLGLTTKELRMHFEIFKAPSKFQLKYF